MDIKDLKIKEFEKLEETIRTKMNIVDTVQKYISLDKRGDSYWACCPFHQEETPSFCVNETEQCYHCFGCGSSGDVIKFVSEIENIDYYETVKKLAEQNSIDIETFTK